MRYVRDKIWNLCIAYWIDLKDESLSNRRSLLIVYSSFYSFTTIPDHDSWYFLFILPAFRIPTYTSPSTPSTAKFISTSVFLREYSTVNLSLDFLHLFTGPPFTRTKYGLYGRFHILNRKDYGPNVTFMYETGYIKSEKKQSTFLIVTTNNS